LIIFITGETGFVGGHLSKYLEKLGITLLKSEGGNNINNKINENTKNRFDVLDKEKLDDLTDNIDAIIHLASKTSITNSITNPYETYYTNFVGTLNILDFVKEKKIKKLINISTYVYGKPLYLPIDESHPINPHSPYNGSKVLAEILCENYSKYFGLNIVTLRPFYIYGPAFTNSSFIPSILRQINTQGRVTLSQQNTKRDFLFIDDFVNLLFKIIKNFPKGYNIYNVGSGKSYSLEQVIKIVEDIMKRKIEIRYDKSIRPNDILEMVADITSVSNTFEWKPNVGLEEGLNNVINNS
jgi:nucleoside-diphosphate-sugar epimerase